ncbi:NAD-P-binding protein [Mycena crocata]|nr:NAD-P-binding protein [Mycena crocata]
MFSVCRRLRGIGLELTLAALRRGDKVIATTRQRSLSQLEDLGTAGADTLELDVTSPPAALAECAKKAFAIHGAFLACGAAEETSVNLFGALNVARAFLPFMRKQKSGPGISETMDMELSPLGLRSINFEPGYFRSKFIDPGNRTMYENSIEDYKPMIMEKDELFKSLDGKQPGDTQKLVEIIVDVVKGEGVAEGKKVPCSLQIGPDCYAAVKADLEERLAILDAWKDVSTSTDLPK